MAHTIVTLTTDDGQEVKCEKSTIEMSSTVKDLLSEMSDSSIPIPIQNVKGNTLAKIIEWATYHKEHPDPPVCDADKYRTDNISDWDTAFMNVDMDMLFDLVQAANYLDIRGLLELCCKTIANMIKGSTPEEVKEKFKLRAAAN